MHKFSIICSKEASTLGHAVRIMKLHPGLDCLGMSKLRLLECRRVCARFNVHHNLISGRKLVSKGLLFYFLFLGGQSSVIVLCAQSYGHCHENKSFHLVTKCNFNLQSSNRVIERTGTLSLLFCWIFSISLPCIFNTCIENSASVTILLPFQIYFIMLKKRWNLWV